MAVLGCQTLRELRGKIACVSDVVVPGDCSAAGVAATEPRANVRGFFCHFTSSNFRWRGLADLWQSAGLLYLMGEG